MRFKPVYFGFPDCTILYYIISKKDYKKLRYDVSIIVFLLRYRTLKIMRENPELEELEKGKKGMYVEIKE